MQILRQLAKIEVEDIKRVFADHFQRDYILTALMKPYCYLASIDQHDLEILLMNSSPQDPRPYPATFYTIADTISQLMTNESFLNQEPLEHGLNGQEIFTYRMKFQRGEIRIADNLPFILDHPPNRPDKGRYVIDGMHRLIAYLLWDDHVLPINVYYCSNTSS